MRPHRLRFSGIGPYPGDVEINFDDLNHKGLYLIVGPTGAGKTTILDAVTYALYGKVAQSRENAIVSAHDHAERPVIEFEFSQGERRYLVHREPAPPGKSSLPHKQWARIFDFAGNEIEVITNARQVTNTCGEVVGLTADEFMQVILLPQGKFQQFLMATGSDKQKVLKTIFGTWTYQQISERLLAQAKRLEQEVADDAEELQRKWAVIDSALQSLPSSELFDHNFNPKTDLKLTVEYISQQLKLLDEADSLARSDFSKISAAHESASREAIRFDTAQKMKSLRAEHISDFAAVEQARNQIDLHRAAVPVVSAADVREDAIAQADEVLQTVSNRRRQLDAETKKLKVLESVTKTWSDGLPTATPSVLSTEFGKMYSRITDANAKFQRIEELNLLIKVNTNESTESEKSIVKLEKAITAVEARAKKSRSALTIARSKAKGLRAAEKALNDLNALIELSDIASAKAELSRTSVNLSRAEKAFDRAERALRAARDQRTKQLAGVLATELSPGDECPVCGSTDHPRKARSTAKPKNDIESLESARNSAQRSVTNAERDVKQAQVALEQAQKHLKDLPSQARQAKIEETYANLTKFAEQIEDLEESVDEDVEELRDLRESLAEERREATRILTEGKALLKEHGGLLKAVEGIGTAKAVEGALKSCEILEDLLVDLTKRVDELATTSGKVTASTGSFNKALKASPFQDEKSARTALVGEETLTRLNIKVQTHDAREIEIGRLEAVVGSDPLPSSRPDVDSLAEQLRLAETASARASSDSATVRTALTQILAAQSDIDRIGPSIQEKETRATEAMAIATVFDRGAGGANGQLSLEVWVQRTLFEEVCLVANEQLRSLSSNRYSLTLEQEEGGVKKRKGSGLDIYVLDSHTGKTRPVQTMSGGEQFIASLALALALAEVVQRHAGGIELPCLFIDEGFGGLDLDSLDIAIEVLAKIQAAGRTVGIITHVETMQQQLPIGIRVAKTERGSTLEVLAS